MLTVALNVYLLKKYETVAKSKLLYLYTNTTLDYFQMAVILKTVEVIFCLLGLISVVTQ